MVDPRIHLVPRYQSLSMTYRDSSIKSSTYDDGRSRSHDLVSLASSGADPTPPQSSFRDSPVMMFPDTGRLSIPLIPIGPSGSVGSLSSVVQDPDMQTLVAGLQYMFRQQIGSIGPRGGSPRRQSFWGGTQVSHRTFEPRHAC
jgi:hypothetical protein